jgi:hypothetical protein
MKQAPRCDNSYVVQQKFHFFDVPPWTFLSRLRSNQSTGTVHSHLPSSNPFALSSMTIWCLFWTYTYRFTCQHLEIHNKGKSHRLVQHPLSQTRHIRLRYLLLQQLGEIFDRFLEITGRALAPCHHIYHAPEGGRVRAGSEPAS